MTVLDVSTAEGWDVPDHGEPPGPPEPDDEVAGAARAREIGRLADEFTDVAVHLSLVQVRLVDLARELLALQGGIIGSVATWLTSYAGLSSAETKRLCRLARRLPELPLIDDAFRAGRLSLETADLLAKVATPANERAVLETAGTATGCQLRKIIRQYRAARAADTPAADRDEHVSYGTDDTHWWLHGRVGYDRGAEIEAALRAAKDDLYRSKAPPEDEPDPDFDPVPRSISTADALAHLSRAYLETRLTTAGQLPERFQAIIHINLPGDGPERVGPAPTEKPEKRTAAPEPRSGIDPDDIAYLRGIGAIGGSTLDRLLCNASISTITSRGGVPLTATSPTRLATPAQKRALLAHHPTCQFPGCGHTAYLEAHHLIAHHTGNGPTTWSNLALLCTACHTRLHQPGWSAALTDDHTLLVWDPRGNLLNRGALRPDPAPHHHDGDCGCGTSEFRKSEIRALRHRPGAGERLTPFALSVYLHAWLTTAA